MSAALTNYERWERELQDNKMRGKAKPAEPMDAAERANRFHLEVLGTLAGMGIVTPLEGYLKPGAPSVSSAIKGVARQAEQAARQDERRKVLKDCANICKQHAINAERRAAGHSNVAALNSARDKQTAHQWDESVIRALAEEVT